MKYEEGDINKNFGVILFVILISLFAFTFEGTSNQNASGSAYYSLQYDLASGYCTGQSDAVISDTPQLSFVVKDCGCSLSGTDLNLFHLQYSISEYNRKIVQNIISVQKTRLSIEPFSVWKYSFHLSSGEKEDLPVLS
jgi:hypothetical protein